VNVIINRVENIQWIFKIKEILYFDHYPEWAHGWKSTQEAKCAFYFI